MPDKVCIFWDNSNVYIAGKNVAGTRETAMAVHELRIEFENLYQLAAAGREVERAICVGSVPPELDAVWTRLRRTGVEVELYERGAESGREQGIDQCLQVHMLRAVTDIHPPGVAVLVTGDGAGYALGKGFYADLERMHKAGWGVELISWDVACNGALKRWASNAGVYIKLEDHYDFVTFRERKRAAVARHQRRPYAHSSPAVITTATITQ
jgi:hypothetical protein